jgi:hypothetical protein
MLGDRGKICNYLWWANSLRSNVQFKIEKC